MHNNDKVKSAARQGLNAKGLLS